VSFDVDALIEEARSWKGTPYHHMARVKGAGVDCGQLLVACFAAAGYMEDFDPGYYTSDWHLHRDVDLYLQLVEKYMDRAEGDNDLPLADRKDFRANPGDVLMFRVGRVYSHGAIVTDWPNIVHSYLPSEMVEEVSLINTPMSVRPMRRYVPRISQ